MAPLKTEQQDWVSANNRRWGLYSGIRYLVGGGGMWGWEGGCGELSTRARGEGIGPPHWKLSNGLGFGRWRVERPIFGYRGPCWRGGMWGWEGGGGVPSTHTRGGGIGPSLENRVTELSFGKQWEAGPVFKYRIPCLRCGMWGWESGGAEPSMRTRGRGIGLPHWKPRDGAQFLQTTSGRPCIRVLGTYVNGPTQRWNPMMPGLSCMQREGEI
jgi:hypothetical protein